MTTPDRDIVFFVGAGFSKEAGLPVMSEFGTESAKDRDGLAKHVSPDTPNHRYAAKMLLDAASTFYGFQTLCKKSSILNKNDYENLETLFCIAEALDESGQKHIEIEGEPRTLSSVVSDFQLWIWKAHQQFPIFNSDRPGNREPYDSFFKLLKSKSLTERITVLSTNYDIVYEYLSWEHNIPCEYPISWNSGFSAGHGSKTYIHQRGSNQGAVVCKLHGSINFFEDHEQKDNHDKLFVAADLGDAQPIGKSGVWQEKPAILAVDAIWNIRERYGAEFTPAIIPPSYAKLGRKKCLTDIWNTALEALKKAKLIIFLGYSMPESDGFMRALLHGAMALREGNSPLEVYLVDPCIEVHQRYQRFFGQYIKDIKPQGFAEATTGELKNILERLMKRD